MEAIKSFDATTSSRLPNRPTSAGAASPRPPHVRRPPSLITSPRKSSGRTRQAERPENAWAGAEARLSYLDRAEYLYADAQDTRASSLPSSPELRRGSKKRPSVAELKARARVGGVVGYPYNASTAAKSLPSSPDLTRGAAAAALSLSLSAQGDDPSVEDVIISRQKSPERPWWRNAPNQQLWAGGLPLNLPASDERHHAFLTSRMDGMLPHALLAQCVGALTKIQNQMALKAHGLDTLCTTRELDGLYEMASTTLSGQIGVLRSLQAMAEDAAPGLPAASTSRMLQMLQQRDVELRTLSMEMARQDEEREAELMELRDALDDQLKRATATFVEKDLPIAMLERAKAEVRRDSGGELRAEVEAELREEMEAMKTEMERKLNEEKDLLRDEVKMEVNAEELGITVEQMYARHPACTRVTCGTDHWAANQETR